jgi:hypothetical protein
MWWFVTGFALGWVVGGWYQRTGGRDFGEEIGHLQARARDALDESARIVEQSKRELQSAVQSGTGEGGGGGRAPRRRGPPRRQRGQRDEPA